MSGACVVCKDLGFTMWTEQPQGLTFGVTLKMQQCACYKGTPEKLEAAMRVFAQTWDAEYQKVIRAQIEAATNNFLYGNPHGPARGPTPKGVL